MTLSQGVRPLCKRFAGAGRPVAVAALLTLASCTPALNWRDVRLEPAGLAALLPCKPDKAERSVPLLGQPTALTMLGCDAGGMTFAIASADVGDPAKVAEALAQWQRASLLTMRGTPLPGSAGSSPLSVRGAALQPAPQLIAAQGKRADGSPVEGRAAYFARGSRVFQAVLYGQDLQPSPAETFFGALHFD